MGIFHLDSAKMIDEVYKLVDCRINELSDDIREKISKFLHENPELAYEEILAHDTLSTYLENIGFKVKRSTYGLKTSFEACLGEEGRLVIFCCEYDALPGIGHACGHNLIAASSMAAFLGTAHAITSLKIPGRLRILGTPAEERGGGKMDLIKNGAFDPREDVAAAIMCHPLSQNSFPTMSSGSYSGLAGLRFIANHNFTVEFRGKTAHAAGEPWNGTNALDAAVAAYNNAALLRQQIRPDERIHAIIDEGGVAVNVICEYARMRWGVRAPTLARSEALRARVIKCIEAAATATGCTHELSYLPATANLRVNETLCRTYVDDMARFGERVQLNQERAYNASTDMGNVSHFVPSFHGAFAVPTPPGVAIHSPQFAAAAATAEGHNSAMQSAKGMAMLACRVFLDDNVAEGSRRDFEQVDCGE